MSARPSLVRPLPAVVLAAATVAALVVVPAAQAKKPTSVTKTAGGVTAKVTYTPANPKKYTGYTHLRLSVTGPAGKLRNVSMVQNHASHVRPILTLVDLNADGVPDPVVDTFSGGAHCCSVGSIALSTPTGWSAPITQGWGDYGYSIKDLGGTATPELVSADDRFAYAFSAYAASIPAIQIWSVAGGTYHDVTRDFPDAVRADAATISGYWDTAAKDSGGDPEAVQSATAAWVAELATIGDLAGAKAVIDKTTAAGFMKGGPKEDWEQASTFAGQLSYDLKAWGYLADPTQIGLPAPPA